MAISYNSKGFTFVDGQPVSAADLNNLVDSSTWNTNAISGQEAAIPSSSSQILFVEGSSFKQCTAPQVGSALSGLSATQVQAGSVFLTALGSNLANKTIVVASSKLVYVDKDDSNTMKLGSITDFCPTQSLCKGWVQSSIAGSVASSYNVTSITNNGTGDFSVTWTTSFSNTNYCVVTGLEHSAAPINRFVNLQSKLSSAVRILLYYVSDTVGSSTLTNANITNFYIAAYGTLA